MRCFGKRKRLLPVGFIKNSYSNLRRLEFNSRRLSIFHRNFGRQTRRFAANFSVSKNHRRRLFYRHQFRRFIERRHDVARRTRNAAAARRDNQISRFGNLRLRPQPDGDFGDRAGFSSRAFSGFSARRGLCADGRVSLAVYFSTAGGRRFAKTFRRRL